MTAGQNRSPVSIFQVYDGLEYLGEVLPRGERFAATLGDGAALGLFDTWPEARDAIISAARDAGGQ
jgi:hypothetical protein